MHRLHPELTKNLRSWQESKLSGRRNGKAVFARCLRFLAWATVHGDTLTSWRGLCPEQIDNFVEHRRRTGRKTANGKGCKPLREDTIARDIQATREWLEWNERREMAGPIRSQYFKGQSGNRRAIDKFTLSDEQCAWLLQRSRWVAAGQTSLKYTEPSTGKRKSAWCKHWPAGAFRLFIRFGLELGLRPRELFWLAWEDFEGEGFDGLTAGGQRVVLSVRDHDGEHGAVNTVKSENSYRRLILPGSLADELAEFKNSRMRESTARFLFAVPPGAPGNLSGAWRKPEISFIFRALREELGEPRLVCNTLRKTCGQRLRRAGMDYFAIAQFLGHSATTCMRYYVQDCREDEAFDPVTCKPVALRAVEA